MVPPIYDSKPVASYVPRIMIVKSQIGVSHLFIQSVAPTFILTGCVIECDAKLLPLDRDVLLELPELRRVHYRA